jgi:hypothetical protein
MPKTRYTPADVALAIQRASATVKPEQLAERVARFLRTERLVGRWPAIVHALQHPDRSKSTLVVTAQPLPEASLKKLQSAGGDVVVVVRPSLLGGAIVRRGDRQVDLSLKTKLRELESALSKA